MNIGVLICSERKKELRNTCKLYKEKIFEIYILN